MGSDVLDDLFHLEFGQHINSVKLLNLWLSELIDKLSNMEETTTDSDKNLVALLNFEMYFSLSELIHTLRLSQEHDLHLLLFREVVDEVSKSLVDRIANPWHVSVQQLVDSVICLLKLAL